MAFIGAFLKRMFSQILCVGLPLAAIKIRYNDLHVDVVAMLLVLLILGLGTTLLIHKVPASIKRETNALFVVVITCLSGIILQWGAMGVATRDLFMGGVAFFITTYGLAMLLPGFYIFSYMSDET